MFYWYPNDNDIFDKEFSFLVCGTEIDEENEFTTVMLSENTLEEVRFIFIVMGNIFSVRILTVGFVFVFIVKWSHGLYSFLWFSEKKM